MRVETLEVRVDLFPFNETEARMMRELANEHSQAAAKLARVEMAIRVAIAAMCAAHGLEGDWRLADDLSGLVRAKKMHEAEAVATVDLSGVSHGN